MRKIFVLFFAFILAYDLGSFTNLASAQDGNKKEKVVYKYKQYEKFDFEELSVAGEGGSPGDLSSGIRSRTEFKNKLPLKKDFNPEIRKSVERVQ